ncbi:glycosyltransferase [Paenibacillus sp. 481]|uniref:glycosyltransferase n=1 Tax=Paenibacillus sp. 481 TaxID=2835869 RepID=UPI001E462033|nr:glycosyltransferase [Paenibacillus sp. 481]UHA75035.1 glycosyltransferase [Paenibacillus sp. 481]
MIVRDEQHVLARCLQAASSVVSEIIIVDTGSVDDTLHIAAKYGALVHHHAWADDFATARNLSIEMATQPWILVLDADEVLDFDSWQPQLLLPLLADEQAFGYYVTCAHLSEPWFTDKERPATIATDMVCRLFRNDKRIRFQGRIHEEAATAVAAIAPHALGWSQLCIWHDGYTDIEIKRKRKSERNFRLIQLMLIEEAANPVWPYAYGTEHFQLQQYDQALPWLLQAIEMICAEPEPHPGYASDIWLKTVYAMQASGRSDTALQLANQALTYYPDYPDLLELNASLLLGKQQYAEARTAALNAVQYEATSQHYQRYTSTAGAGKWRSYWLAGYASEHLHDYATAYQCYKRACHTFPFTLGQLALTCASCWMACCITRHPASAHRAEVPEIEAEFNKLKQIIHVLESAVDQNKTSPSCQKIKTDSDPTLEAITRKLSSELHMTEHERHFLLGTCYTTLAKRQMRLLNQPCFSPPDNKNTKVGQWVLPFLLRTL